MNQTKRCRSYSTAEIVTTITHHRSANSLRDCSPNPHGSVHQFDKNRFYFRLMGHEFLVPRETRLREERLKVVIAAVPATSGRSDKINHVPVAFERGVNAQAVPEGARCRSLSSQLQQSYKKLSTAHWIPASLWSRMHNSTNLSSFVHT